MGGGYGEALKRTALIKQRPKNVNFPKFRFSGIAADLCTDQIRESAQF
jgi:hypothetical protein